MKNYKLFLLLFLVIYLCGCTATYKININNSQVKEELKLIEMDSSKFDVPNDSGWTLRNIFDSLLEDDIFSEEEYDVNSLSNDKQLGIEYKSEYLIDELSKSSIINQCYNNFKITEDEQNIYINTGNDFKCYEYYKYLDSVIIKLETNHEIIDSNAKLINGNVYTWEFTEFDNKEINLTISKVNIKDNNFIVYVLISLLLILFMIGYWLYNKNKLKNKF